MLTNIFLIKVRWQSAQTLNVQLNIFLCTTEWWWLKMLDTDIMGDTGRAWQVLAMLSSANLLIQEYFHLHFFFLIRGVKLFFSVNSLSYSLFIIKILVLFVICRVLYILILNLMLQIFFPICPLPLKFLCYAHSFEYLYRWVFCSFPLWFQPLPFWF